LFNHIRQAPIIHADANGLVSAGEAARRAGSVWLCHAPSSKGNAHAYNNSRQRSVASEEMPLVVLNLLPKIIKMAMIFLNLKAKLAM